MKKNVKVESLFMAALLTGCAQNLHEKSVVPSLEYALRVGGGSQQDAAKATVSTNRHARYLPESDFRDYGSDHQRARLRLASQDSVNGEADYAVEYSQRGNVRDYNGPLSLGDPGVSASLWQESRGETDLFHDHRAWQPMDLITIVVTENSEGKKEADTDVKSSSSFKAAIENLLGYENDVVESNPGKEAGTSKVDLTNLINASSENEFKGEGETTRKGSLKAKISAMVVEVLPSGVLRVEGEKIISVNSEEQIMVISGLIRTRDVSSVNEVDSSKIANMRIDYFGRGTVGSAQYGGWLSNILRVIWPF